MRPRPEQDRLTWCDPHSFCVHSRSQTEHNSTAVLEEEHTDWKDIYCTVVTYQAEVQQESFLTTTILVLETLPCPNTLTISYLLPVILLNWALVMDLVKSDFFFLSKGAAEEGNLFER